MEGARSYQCSLCCFTTKNLTLLVEHDCGANENGRWSDLLSIILPKLTFIYLVCTVYFCITNKIFQHEQMPNRTIMRINLIDNNTKRMY